MENLRLKFTIQGLDDAFSGAIETNVQQVTPDWIRFTAPADIIESPGEDPLSTFAKQYRVMMFIYLQPTGAPIQALGRIAMCEPSADEQQDIYNILVEFQEIAEEDRQRLKEYLETVQGSTFKERRQEIRRRGDLFILELKAMLEILVDMSRGRRVEFGEQFANLVGVKNTLGRRMDDKKSAEVICYLIEQIASNLADHFGKQTGLRHVRIRKVTGRDAAVVAKDRTFPGWEEAPPQIGKIYCLYLHGGGIFRTTLVTQVEGNHFHTRNSLYEIQQI